MSIELQEINNFIGEEECLQLIKMIDKQNAPSLVATGYNHGEVSDFRTSSTSNLDPNNLLVKGLHQKIADYLGLPITKGESLQGQVYETGQYFKPHTDYFEGEHYQQHCLSSGNRTHTLMIYLNDVPEGGQTDFSNINQTVNPKMGKAIIWRNMDSEGNTLPDSLHEGTPPTRGKKYVITSWWRENNWNGGEDANLAQNYNNSKNTPPPQEGVIQLNQTQEPQPEVIEIPVEEPVQTLPTEGPKVGETKPIGDLINMLGLENVKLSYYTNHKDFPKYHSKGFEVVQVPEEIMGVINDAYNILKIRGGHREDWDGLDSVINGGETMPEMYNFDHIPSIRNFIHEMLRGMHQAWAQTELTPEMVYGIRSYEKGNTLIMHTDRLDTHHISCIIIVDKDLEGGPDWPLRIQSHDGEYHDVYAEVGQMILYESVACEHGRPTPFEGNYFRNFYAHYSIDGIKQV